MSYILFKECELPSAQATSPPGLNRTFWVLTRPLSTWTSGPGDGGLSLTSACCPKVQLTGTRGWCLAQAHDLCPFLNFPVPLHFGKSRDNCFPHHEHGTPVHYNLFGYGDFFFFGVCVGTYLVLKMKAFYSTLMCLLPDYRSPTVPIPKKDLGWCAIFYLLSLGMLIA